MAAPMPSKKLKDKDKGCCGCRRRLKLDELRQALVQVEDELLQGANIHLTKESIPLRDPNLLIRTIYTPPVPDKVPIVLIHGLCSGSAIWMLNYEELGNHRQVFAIDLLGFGQSTRCKFEKDSKSVELQFVKSIDEWRERLGIETFILLAHSMGGFISCAYALTHPARVAHLILDEPWGFTQANWFWRRFGRRAITGRPIAYRRFWRFFISGLNLTNDARTASSLNEWKDNIHQTMEIYYEYCNSFKPATGEKAFSRLSMFYGFRARNPMLQRLPHLEASVPVTFLIGEKSFIRSGYMDMLHTEFPDHQFDVHLLPSTNHDIHITQSERFNQIVNDIGIKVDETMQERAKFRSSGNFLDSCMRHSSGTLDSLDTTKRRSKRVSFSSNLDLAHAQIHTDRRHSSGSYGNGKISARKSPVVRRLKSLDKD